MTTKSKASRQSAEFQCWMIRNDKDNKWLAELLGVSVQRACTIKRSGVCSPAQRKELKKAGVDKISLPVATSGRPGIQPREKK